MFARKHRKCGNIAPARFIWLFYKQTKAVFFFIVSFLASNVSPQGAAMLIRFLPRESSEKIKNIKFARDVFDTFTTRAGLVHDVTDIDC